MLQQKVHLCFQSSSLDNTLNRPSSQWENFNITQKLGLFILRVTHISNIPKVCVTLMQVGGGSNTLIKIWLMKYRFSLKSFLILRKNIYSFKGRPSENSFNIAKNQEFELIPSHHFKNLISPKPPWSSRWSLIPLRNLKWY